MSDQKIIERRIEYTEKQRRQIASFYAQRREAEKAIQLYGKAIVDATEDIHPDASINVGEECIVMVFPAGDLKLEA